MKQMVKYIALAPLMIVSSVAAATGTVDMAPMAAATGTVAAAAPAANAGLSTAPTLVSKSATGVTITWEKVASAPAYIVKYSKTSVAKSQNDSDKYDNESDPITQTGTTIDGLQAGTTYYFSVVVMDADGRESAYSDELPVTTDGGELVASGVTVSSGSVKAGDVTVGTGVAAALGAISPIDFVVTEAVAETATGIIVKVSSVISEKQLHAQLVRTADNSAVPVAVLSAEGAEGKTFRIVTKEPLAATTPYTLSFNVSGPDVKEFTVSKEFTTSATLVGAASAVAPTDDLNAAAGTGVSASGALAATETKELPATGAKENIMLFLALVLSFGLVYAFQKKRA